MFPDQNLVLYTNICMCVILRNGFHASLTLIQLSYHCSRMVSIRDTGMRNCTRFVSLEFHFQMFRVIFNDRVRSISILDKKPVANRRLLLIKSQNIAARCLLYSFEELFSSAGYRDDDRQPLSQSWRFYTELYSRGLIC